MFGREAKCIDHSSSTAFDRDSHPAHLCAKLAELGDLVKSRFFHAAWYQKTNYDQQSCRRTFRTSDLVWLSWPTAGKLDPEWEGNCNVKAVKSPCNVEITRWAVNQRYMSIAFDIGCSQQQTQLPQLLTLDTTHNKAGIHLKLTMFCFPHPASHLSLHSPLGVIRRKRDDHLIASHKLKVEL